MRAKLRTFRLNLAPTSWAFDDHRLIESHVISRSLWILDELLGVQQHLLELVTCVNAHLWLIVVHLLFCAHHHHNFYLLIGATFINLNMKNQNQFSPNNEAKAERMMAVGGNSVVHSQTSSFGRATNVGGIPQANSKQVSFHCVSFKFKGLNSTDSASLVHEQTNHVQAVARCFFYHWRQGWREVFNRRPVRPCQAKKHLGPCLRATQR